MTTSMETVAKLIKDQMVRFSSISRIVPNLKKKGKAKWTEARLQGCIGDLQAIWSNCCSIHASIMDADNPDVLASLPYVAKEQFSIAEDDYEESLAFIRENLPSSSQALLTSSLPSTSGQVRERIEPKLPQLSVPCFSGSSLSWVSFRDLFKSIVIDNSHLSNVERLQYLKLALTGEAARVLQHVSVSEGEFEAAWESLLELYDDTRILVNAHLNVIFEIAPVKGDILCNLKQMRDKLRTSLNALKALKRPTENWDDWIICYLSPRLDKTSRVEWEGFVGGLKNCAFPTLSQFQTFVNNRVRTLEILNGSENNICLEINKKSAVVNKSTFLSIKSTTVKCRFCAGEHRIYACSKYAALSVKERFNFVKSANLCINCLSPGHSLNGCKSKYRCAICRRSHHKLLHMNRDRPESREGEVIVYAESQPGPSASNPPDREIVNISSMYATPGLSRCRHKSILATARVVICNETRGFLNVRALLDQASESTFVSEDVVNALRLPTQTTLISVHGLSGSAACTATRVALFHIRPAGQEHPIIPVRAPVIKTISSIIPNSLPMKDCPSEFRNLHLADPNPSETDQVDLLIGSDLYASIFQLEAQRSVDQSLLAQNTIFGWVITGSGPITSTPPLTLSFRTSIIEPDINDTLQKFWELEQVPESPLLTDEDLHIEKHFIDTHSRNSNGRYCVRLPFKQSPSNLGSSFNIAKASFVHLEKRFSRDRELASQYDKFISEYQTMGHMVPDDKNSETTFGLFLPHHSVWRQNVPLSKFRVVFNASSPTSSGLSLNDCLSTGPKLQQDLLSVLLRWRSHRYVITTDIVKMFRQIEIDSRDQCFQKLLWRKSPNEPISSYRLTTVTYGLASAPFLALRVLRQLVTDEGTKYPLAAPILLHNTYIDDILFGADDLPLLRLTQGQLVELLGSAGLPLSKWASNCPAFTKSLSLPSSSSSVTFDNPEFPGVKILGLSWDPASDTFHFFVEPPLLTSITKRTVLSVISRLFDPLGWLSPVIIVAKILLQNLWNEQVDWDQDLPSLAARKWQSFARALPDISRIRIPRWSGLGSSISHIEIHGFSDASLQAYAACIYVRLISFSGSIKTTLLAAKSKVAPVKSLSIPRLELCGALLLARLARFVLDNLNFSTGQLICWCDSQIVLAWLNRPPAHWQVFVANRVSQIVTTIPEAQWRFVPTHSNPADLSTRGVLAKDLVNSELWWNGPLWLRLPESQWPTRAVIEPTSLELKTSIVLHSVTPYQEWDFIFRYSSWSKLLRVTARLLQAVRCLRRIPNGKSCRVLSSIELQEAATFWVRYVQQRAFASEFRSMVNSKPLAKNSVLLSLDPFLDESGLFRLGGRLRHAAMDESIKHPLILPRHHISELIIEQLHRNILHGGLQLTLRTLRQQYWILNARSLVKSCIHRCIQCTRASARLASQKMGDLPSPRCSPSRPFSHCGIDYAGPMSVCAIKGRGCKSVKCWIALFVCLSSRAIHLELVHSLDTASFLAAFDRFVSRRGVPSDVYSDNGTNFVGANRELQRLFRSVTRDSGVLNQLASKGIFWHFNPPAAPHFGGLWEAGVRSVKYHLRRVLGDATPSVEEFSTLLCRVEACLNSRPIAPLRDDPESFDALTPGHFLVGSSLLCVPEASVLEVADTRLSRWQLWQKRLQLFWRRWKGEYLNSLQMRSKWRSVKNNVQIGDLVIIKNPALPPCKWELGRVIKCIRGADNLVRVLTIKTVTSTITRPITQVVPLPVSCRSID